MNIQFEPFLRRLLETASPSGFESEASLCWREEAEGFADEVFADSFGNSFARLQGNGPRILIEGHIDEIGLMVTHIDRNGFLWLQPIGGWDAQVLVGQRVRVLTKDGPVAGAVGKKPAHQLTERDRSKASRIDDLWIDIGASSADEAGTAVRIGDPAVIEQPLANLRGDRISGRGLDNKIGAFVALEALRSLSKDQDRHYDIWAVAAAQEEIGQRGASTSSFHLNPDLAIVIDVSHATDHPDANVRAIGARKIGGGAVLTRGSAVNPEVFEALVTAASSESLPWMIEPKPRRTGTDADAIGIVRSGIPTGLVKIPLRYMHSPNELVSLIDVEACIGVIAAFARNSHGCLEQLNLSNKR